MKCVFREKGGPEGYTVICPVERVQTMMINGLTKGESKEKQKKKKGLAQNLKKQLYLGNGILNKSQLRRQKKKNEKFGSNRGCYK